MESTPGIETLIFMFYSYKLFRIHSPIRKLLIVGKLSVYFADLLC
jgi:hypothetical protein